MIRGPREKHIAFNSLGTRRHIYGGWKKSLECQPEGRTEAKRMDRGQHTQVGSLILLVLVVCGELTAQTVTLNIPAQAGYDNTVITSFVDGNGNPIFLSGSGSTLTIKATTTPLTLMIAGTYQQLISDTALNVSNSSGASQVQFVYAKQDLSNATLQLADFGTTALPPVYSYSAPTGSTGQFWFDLSTNLMKSWNGSSFVATPAVFLGRGIRGQTGRSTISRKSM
jgi:hypothetical protein